VDLLGDPRFDWFGWRNKVPSFEMHLTPDHVLEYHDRLQTIFHNIAMPVQRLSESSVERLIDLCKKVSKKKR
jgi:hypothetical protein